MLNRISDVLAVNPEGVALFAGLGRWPRSRWNTIRYLFLHPTARDLFVDWQDVATSAVAHLHAALANPTQDAADSAAFIRELSASSHEFVRLWERYDVQERRSRSKTFQHPAIGKLTLHEEILHLSDDGLRLNIYQAEPGSADETALTLLSLDARDPLDLTANQGDTPDARNAVSHPDDRRRPTQ